MALQQGHLIGARQVSVVRNTLIKIMGDKVEDILLKVCSRAADRMNFILPDHLGKRETEFRGAHGSRNSHEHGATFLKVSGVGMSGILQGRGIKVAVVMLDEVGDGTGCGHGKMMKEESVIMKDETL